MANKTKKIIDIFGIKITNLTFNEVISGIDLFIRENKPSFIFTTNANHVRLFKEDPEFAAAYTAADIVTIDGWTVQFAVKMLGTPIKERVCGSDLTERLCSLSAEKGYRIYFLGTSKENVQKAKSNCENLYPGIKIVGTYSPKRAEILNEGKSREIIAQINKTNANIIFVAFGSPLQEKWLNKHKSLLKAPVSIGVGGSLDYLAGTLKRPPIWVRRIGMEWLARLIQNPRHYAMRYLKDLLIFYYIFRKLLKLR